MFKVGKVTHYYDKLGVAIVELDGTLSVGDHVKFVHDGGDLFEQTVESIQIEHEKVNSADRGSVIGLQTKQHVQEKSEVYKAG